MQYTIWCPASLRDEFDDYCNLVATPAEQQRLTRAYEAFHQLFADVSGQVPPIKYSAPPLTPQNAIEMEVRVFGARFFVDVDYTNRIVWLNGITI